MAARRLRRACSVWDTVSKRCGTSKGPALWRGLHAMGAGTSGNKGRWTRSKHHLPTRSTGRRMDRGTTKTKDTERARRWRGAEKGSASRPVFLGYWPRRPLQKSTWTGRSFVCVCVCVCVRVCSRCGLSDADADALESSPAAAARLEHAKQRLQKMGSRRRQRRRRRTAPGTRASEGATLLIMPLGPCPVGRRTRYGTQTGVHSGL